MPKLTELETVILGVLEQEGPITTYAVSQVFASSVSSRWSGTVGGIYPAMARLESRKLVKSQEGSRGQRLHKLLSITPAGRKALRAWLTPPFPEGVGGATEDPIRTRIFSLGLLPHADRVVFLTQAIKSVQSELVGAEQVIKEQAAEGEELAVLGLEGVRYELQARIDWLKMDKRRVGRLKDKLA